MCLWYMYIMQIITVLNHAGLCTYATAWNYLKQLTKESMYLDIIREGCWLWIKKVRHERQVMCINIIKHFISTLIHVPYCVLCTGQSNTCMHYQEHVPLQVIIPHHWFLIIPQCRTSQAWADSPPQWPFNVEDFLPGEADATVLNQRAVHYLMGFLVATFSNLKHLA